MNRSDMNAGTDFSQPEGASAKRANSNPLPVAASASAVSVRPATATVTRSRRLIARAAAAGTAGARPTVPINWSDRDYRQDAPGTPDQSGRDGDQENRGESGAGKVGGEVQPRRETEACGEEAEPGAQQREHRDQK